MKIRSFAMGASLAALLMTGAARAQMHHGDFAGHEMAFLRGLNLSEEQKSQVKDIMKAGWEQMRPLMKQARALHEQGEAQFLSPGQVTADQLQPILAQENALHAQMDAARVDEMLKLRAVLTADQLAKAASMHAQMEQLRAQEHAVMGDEEPAQ